MSEIFLNTEKICNIGQEDRILRGYDSAREVVQSRPLTRYIFMLMATR